MKTVAKDNFTGSQQPSAYQVTIPASMDGIPKLMFSGISFCFAGGLFVMIQLFVLKWRQYDIQNFLFVGGFIVFILSIAIVKFFVPLLWLLFGKEQISVRAGQLLIRRSILGIGSSDLYHTAQITNLRVYPPRLQTLQSMSIQYGQNCCIFFQYEQRTIRFGYNIESLAIEIASHISPNYQSIESRDAG